jgi:KTSC domain
VGGERSDGVAMAQTPKPAPMVPIKSSAFKGYHYDPNTKAFTVQFNNGAKWRYDDVSLERATAFEGADSKGRYFADQIKPHHIATQVFD